jgi:hypothetical protein
MKKPCNTLGLTCGRCHSTAIYLSITPMDLKGTYTCFFCGETVDGRIGINKGDKRINFYVLPRSLRKGESPFKVMGHDFE